MFFAKTIEQDCIACPSSWSGLLTDGRRWRVRYRFGELRFTVDSDADKLSVFSKECPEVFESIDHGDSLDGMISFEEMQNLVSEWIDFSKTAL